MMPLYRDLPMAILQEVPKAVLDMRLPCPQAATHRAHNVLKVQGGVMNFIDLMYIGMTKNYLNNQAAKKSFARKFIILLVILAVILTIVFSHIAMPDNNFLSGNVPPDNKQVYAIAKEFIRPDINSQAVTFPDSGYQC